MSVTFSLPPAPAADSEKALRQIYSYLFTLSRSLNAAGSQISAQTDTQIAKALKSAGSTASDESLKKTAASLKALILSTAETVEGEIDTVQAALKSDVTAVSSQFGTYKEQVSAEITATAAGIVQSYNYDSRIDAVNAAFSSYKTHTEGFIKQGFVSYDDSGIPIVGIAIGQNLKSISTDTGYEQIDENQACAFYTAEKVSFRLGGNEVAYFSNDSLHCGNIDCGEQVTLNGKWLIRAANHFTVKWAGES